MDSQFDLFFNHVVYENLMTADSVEKLILKNGSEYSCDSLAVIGIKHFIDFLKTTFVTELPINRTPTLIITGCGSIKFLEETKYNQDIIQHLNINGLDIHLYEELHLNVGVNVRYYLEGPSLLSNNDNYYINLGPYIQGFESTAENLSLMYSFELNSIKTFIKNNKLTNVTVHCCDYKVTDYFQKSYPMMTLKTNNLYIKTLCKNLSKNNTLFSDQTETITDKFLSLNNRYKGFRHLVVGYLYNKKSKISFDNTKSIHGSLQNQLWFDLASWKKTNKNQFLKLAINLKALKKNNPLKLDNVDNIPNSNFDLSFDYAPELFFKSCFCSVINEADFSRPISSITEKTINAINNYHPFILVAPPHTLKYLKKLGFKTFDKFWDESYDLEENHEKRLIKIFQLIDTIDNKPISYLTTMHKLMKPILIHNYNIIRNIADE